MGEIRGKIQKLDKDSPSGAVIIYLDGLLIFLRVCELISRLFKKERIS